MEPAYDHDDEHRLEVDVLSVPAQREIDIGGEPVHDGRLPVLPELGECGLEIGDFGVVLAYPKSHKGCDADHDIDIARQEHIELYGVPIGRKEEPLPYALPGEGNPLDVGEDIDQHKVLRYPDQYSLDAKKNIVPCDVPWPNSSYSI